MAIQHLEGFFMFKKVLVFTVFSMSFGVMASESTFSEAERQAQLKKLSEDIRAKHPDLASLTTDNHYNAMMLRSETSNSAAAIQEIHRKFKERYDAPKK